MLTTHRQRVMASSRQQQPGSLRLLLRALLGLLEALVELVADALHL
jgi:hypothetical protein